MTKHKYIEIYFDIPYKELNDDYLRATRDMPPEIAEKVKKGRENSAAYFAAWLNAGIYAAAMESTLDERDLKADCRKS
ncbi:MULTISPECIES: hypothetical protein [Pseudomonas]|uniref:Uncharacterized protein n=1 Tax=Pseudomonas putida TaxID=303 RepID=A0A7V8J222_PSEPU|nr:MULTISPECIES: hypothetical protein [Pseudomonas]KAF0252005.1 hypothetical protein GN299_25530 [Pseudomonas putida]MCK2124677.1 hypothetical protein [Pseudomonas sp. PNPG3]